MSNELGLAKSAPQPVSAQAVNHPVGPTTQVNTDVAWVGVPLPVFRFFGVDFAGADHKTLAEIGEAYKFIDTDLDKKSPGNVLEKLSQLEMQLGAPRIGETRYGRILDYLRMQHAIKDVRKQQRALVNGSR